MMYNARTGETFKIDDVSQFEIVTPEGQTIETIDVKHDTRSLLSLVNKGMFSDYDYMPVTTKDVAQLTALGMETSAGTYGVVKMLAGLGGAVFGGSVGAGAMAMLTGLGVEAFEFAGNALKADKPKEFWNEFVNNVNEIKNEDSGFMRFLEGAGIGSSYFSGGASEALYDEWGDVLKKGGSYTAGNVLGTIARVTAGIAAFGGMKPDLAVGQGWANTSTGLIADMSIADGLSEMGNKIGVGTEVWNAAKMGTLIGLASGIAGASTLKAIPWMARSLAPQLVSAFHTYSMVNAVSNGAENAAWYGISQSLAEIFTGEDRPIDPKTMGFMFGAGFGLSYLSHKFSTKALQDEATDKFDIKSLPRETFFENTAKQLNKEETVEIASALTVRDMVMNKQYSNIHDFKKAFMNEWAFAKAVKMSGESGDRIANNYVSRSRYLNIKQYADAMRTGDKIKASPNFNKMSPAAKEIMDENIDILMKMGVSDDEMDSIAQIVFETAFSKTKGQVGNFEIRKAFNEVLGGFL